MEDSGGVVDRQSQSALKLYEAQFFGFTPQTCMLRIYSAFQECLCGILLVVEKVCVRKLDKQDEELLRSKARECSQKLQGFLEQRFQGLSKRMDALLVDNCFSVPPHVLLPGDQPHRKHPQDVQSSRTMAEGSTRIHENLRDENTQELRGRSVSNMH
ncbi:Protein MIS12 [Merluccius polli]|uniref:Protein MIS12 homolog n=1 Tax=Merluccius polli TaxID=89951 RepID=A0AA47N079_MERPO|nr:Protein MIS12 [Merluccius polli]